MLTEGYQSAFVACAVLAGIGLVLALLLLGRPRMPTHEPLSEQAQMRADVLPQPTPPAAV